MKPDPNKVATLKQAEQPKNASELRLCLGMATYSGCVQNEDQRPKI